MSISIVGNVCAGWLLQICHWSSLEQTSPSGNIHCWTTPGCLPHSLSSPAATPRWLQNRLRRPLCKFARYVEAV